MSLTTAPAPIISTNNTVTNHQHHASLAVMRKVSQWETQQQATSSPHALPQQQQQQQQQRNSVSHFVVTSSPTMHKSFSSPSLKRSSTSSSSSVVDLTGTHTASDKTMVRSATRSPSSKKVTNNRVSMMVQNFDSNSSNSSNSNSNSKSSGVFVNRHSVALDHSHQSKRIVVNESKGTTAASTSPVRYASPSLSPLSSPSSPSSPNRHRTTVAGSGPVAVVDGTSKQKELQQRSKPIAGHGPNTVQNRKERGNREQLIQRRNRWRDVDEQFEEKLAQMQQEFERQRQELRARDTRLQDEKRLDEWYRREELKRLEYLQDLIKREEQKKLDRLAQRLETWEAEEVSIVEQKMKEIQKRKRQTQAYQTMVHLHRKSMTPHALSRTEHEQLTALTQQVDQEEKEQLQQLQQLLHGKTSKKKEIIDKGVTLINREQEMFVRQKIEQEKALLKRQMELKHEHESMKREKEGSKPIPPPKPPADSVLYALTAKHNAPSSSSSSSGSSLNASEPKIHTLDIDIALAKAQQPKSKGDASGSATPTISRQNSFRENCQNGVRALVQKALQFKQMYLDIREEYLENEVASAMIQQRMNRNSESDYWDKEESWY